MEKKKRIVIALGGNALGNTLPEQMKAVKITSRAIVDLIQEGCEVVVAHGRHGKQRHDRTYARRSAAAEHAAVRLCCHEPGVHRIRSSERTPRRAVKQRDYRHPGSYHDHTGPGRSG